MGDYYTRAAVARDTGFLAGLLRFAPAIAETTRTTKQTTAMIAAVFLKTAEVQGVERIKDRWVSTKVVFKDALTEGQETEFVLAAIEFNAAIPDHLFTKASLRRVPSAIGRCQAAAARRVHLVVL